MQNLFKIVIIPVIFILVFLVPISKVLAVHVNGYYRSNGTYVNGYERTAPDGNPYNNYSYPGNYNPNTGSITGGNADTYLNNYYKNKSYGSSYYPSSYDYSYPSTPSCPLNSYYDGVSSCQCYYGYVVSGSSCVNAMLYCSDKIGIMSQYNSTSKTCECMSGYEYNGSSCVYKSTSSSLYGASAYDSYTSTYNSCPINSHISSTDSTKCMCDTGYGNNITNDGCILKPIKTDEQLCQDSFGVNSVAVSEKDSNGKSLCNCKSGYEWSSDKKSCIASVISPVVSPINPVNDINTKPKVVNFVVSTDYIENLKTMGVLKKPAAFRQCPSTQCSIIRYYAETSKVNIIGKYKKGNWYQVSGTTDAKGANGKNVIGWISTSLLDVSKK